MAAHRGPFVLFVAAAGPQLGFGHLIRCGVLAEALGARRELVLRGGPAARLAALRLGWTVHQGPRLADVLRPDLILVDVPSPDHRDQWIRTARRAGIAVAAVFDGMPADTDVDLVIDGSFLARPDSRPDRCTGPACAVLSPTITSRRARPVARDPRRVLVALGGGAYVRTLGVAIAEAIVATAPDVHVDLAAGFTDVAAVHLPRNCRWIHATAGLAGHLASAGVAVVAGGVTLYEACALGTPCVAVPVVDAQRPAIAAAVASGAVTGVMHGRRFRWPADVAKSVHALLVDRHRATRQATIAARLVDGRGAQRVAAKLRDLVRASPGGNRHAA